MAKLNLSAPWYIHAKKLAAIFAMDENVTVGDVTETDGGYVVNVSVSNHAKAAALDKILKKSVSFGNITLLVSVVDTTDDETLIETLKDAFAHNRLFRRIETEPDMTGTTERTFIIAEPDVIQFYADDLSDYRRNFNGLAADVARELFDVDGDVNFCTADLTEN